MPNLFTRFIAQNVGTTPVVIYTAPTTPVTQTTCIGLSVANTAAGNSSIAVTITMTPASGTAVNLLRNASVPSGGALSLFGTDGKLILNGGDALAVTSSLANSADVILSVLQIT